MRVNLMALCQIHHANVSPTFAPFQPVLSLYATKLVPTSGGPVVRCCTGLDLKGRDTGHPRNFHQTVHLFSLLTVVHEMTDSHFHSFISYADNNVIITMLMLNSVFS